MRRTVRVDAELLAEARRVCGAGSDTETVRRGLEELVREKAYQQLVALTGSEPGARDVPRRRLHVPNARPAAKR